MKRDSDDKPSEHSHKYVIADNDAVETLITKLQASHGSRGQVDDEKLRQALHTAVSEYKEAGEKERKAFFHGIITGYAVAMKVGPSAARTPGT